MNNDKDELLKQVNIDIIFFFLLVVKAIISFYLINEKKKSILNIPSISNEKANKIYYYKVRAYKTIKNKKVYGPYSTVKYIKIK